MPGRSRTARLVAVVATDEPTEEDERRRAERDDAIVLGRAAAPRAGCGCSIWPPASCAWWTGSATGTSSR